MSLANRNDKISLENIMITEISGDELAAWFAPQDQPRIIEFYGSWCIYHMLTRRRLEELSKELGDDVAVGAIDCLGNEQIFKDCGIFQVPAIAYISNSLTKIWYGETDVAIMVSDITKGHQTREDS